MSEQRFNAPTGYAIRPAAHADAAALANLTTALALELGGEDAGVDAARAAELYLSNRYGLSVLVAARDTEIVAYASHRVEVETAFNAVGRYLSDLYVAVEHRRNGIGRSLLTAVAQIAADEGGTFLWWLAKTDQRGPESLYAQIADVQTPVTAFAATRDQFQQVISVRAERR